MTVSEKAAYLKGLAEGLDIDKTTKEGKLLLAIVETIGDMASGLESLESFTDELSEQVDAIDEDLDNLESEFYDDECDCCDDVDEEFYEVTCPNCNEEFNVDEETLLDGAIECPHCGEKLEFDLDEDDDCGCGCGCHCEDDEDDKQ